MQRLVRSVIASFREAWVLWVVLVIAGALRVGGVFHGISFHPDERHIISVAEKMLRDGDLNPHFFAYGSLPFYILTGCAALLKFFWPAAVSYDGLFIVGRSIAVVCGLVTVWLAYLLGARLGASRRVGVLAAALLSLNVFHIQLSRFYTVDILLAALTAAMLLACCRIARGGGARDFAAAAVVLGLSIATKISALALLAPLGAAVLCAQWSERRWWSARRAALLIGCVVGAGVVFVIAAPYSLLDYELFLRHTNEQITMTRGLWRPPYTVQYANTAPYLYALSEMFWTTLGPLLALVAACGFIAAAARQFRRPNVDEIVVLAGIVPLFLLVAGLQVKFPRYLLPIYPALCVFGAVWLESIGSRLAAVAAAGRRSEAVRNLPALIVLGWCTVSAAAFVGIYAQPHAYTTASEWIYRHAAPGARILGVHWDDKLPISFPGFSAHDYRYRYEGRDHDLEVYEPESPLKLMRMATLLAEHDYLVFPTARTYGSIPRLPDEFRDTTRLFSALFRGDLGYSLVQSVKVRPQFGGLVWNDDLADESFTVYDHPKVLIFRNDGRFDREEITRRIAAAGIDAPLVTREEMLLRDSITPLGRIDRQSSWRGLAVWYLVIQLLAWSIVPFLARVFTTLPDRGLGLSKPLGLLISGYLVWAGTWYAGIPTTAGWGWIVAGLMALAGSWRCLKGWGSWRALCVDLRPHLATVEILFAGVFLAFAAIRACAPEIFWGEKPMDFTFLNYFTRLTALPPHDPWAAGLPMGYYYLGVFLIAFLAKLTGIDTAIVFNLGIASIGAMLAAALYSLAAWFVRSRRGALFAALGVVCFSNWEVLRLALVEGRRLNFDLFWASSRVLTSPAITEYPVWSLLFADLHAHVIALPFAAALAALAIVPLSRGSDPSGARGYAESGLHGFVLGALFALNTWDFISGAALSAVVFALRIALADRGEGRLRAARIVLLDALVVGLTALIVVLPFALTSVSAERIDWGLVRGEFAAVGQVTAHLGQWWLLLGCGLAAGAGGLFSLCRRGTRLRALVSAVLGGALPIVLAAIRTADGLADAPGNFAAAAAVIAKASWGLAGVFALIGAVCGIIVGGRGTRVDIRSAALLGWIGIMAASGAEYLFLMDRMNTIFKFYHFVWLTLGTASLVFAVEGRRALAAASAGRSACGRMIQTAAALGCGAAVVGTIINLFIMVPFQRIPGPRPTLDGSAYLPIAAPDDAPLIEWLRRQPGLPVVLEAHGDAYGPFTRIAMHTGLPTVLGWEHHVRQRGAASGEVARRKADIAFIYSTPEAAAAAEVLQRYNVSLVVVSALERENYPGAGLAKFARFSQFFQPVYRSGDAVIYRFIGGR